MHTLGSFQGNLSHQEMVKSGALSNPQDRTETHFHGPGWYFSRKEIEENSPSRRDGIDLKKEIYLRKAYCTFLQDLGMRLKVPQMTIATAIVFCHRFFLRQSHAKNDRRTIATVCMFLAGKVEETPRPLKDVILVSYEMIHKKDPSAVQKIKQKEVYEQQKELILLGEKVVLTTLGFDFNVQHPYKPVVEAIKKFFSQNGLLAQVAWNFVNDGLRTSLCLQFNPHHIAAGAIFLAAKFLKVKLPSEGDKAWWQEFGVTPRQLEDISNQILELYEQNRAGQSSHPNEVESSAGDGTNHVPKATSIVSENSMSVTGPPQDVETVNVKHVAKVPLTSRSVPALSNADNHRTEHRSARDHSSDNGSTDTKSGVWDHNSIPSGKDKSFCQVKPTPSSREQDAEALSCSKSSLEQPIEEGLTNDMDMAREGKEETMLSKSAGTSGRGSRFDDVITMIDRDKVKAALEKRKRLRNDMVKKADILDEDDLIERELENGIEMAAEDEKMKRERRSGSPELSHKKRLEIEKRNVRVSDQQYSHEKVSSKSSDHGIDNSEETELSSLEENEFSYLKSGDNKETAWVDYPKRDPKRVRCDTLVE